MKKYTVIIQHVSYAFIRESFPVYAPSIDAAYGIALRQKGEWFTIVRLD
jgi:hypothetical protein